MVVITTFSVYQLHFTKFNFLFIASSYQRYFSSVLVVVSDRVCLVCFNNTCQTTTEKVYSNLTIVRDFSMYRDDRTLSRAADINRHALVLMTALLAKRDDILHFPYLHVSCNFDLQLKQSNSHSSNFSPKTFTALVGFIFLLVFIKSDLVREVVQIKKEIDLSYHDNGVTKQRP